MRPANSVPQLKERADTRILQLLRMHGCALRAPMEQGVEVSSLSIPLALAQAGVGVAVLLRSGLRTRRRAACSLCPCSRRCSASCS